MKCKNCGNEIPDTAKFCNKCGAKVEDDFVPSPPINNDSIVDIEDNSYENKIKDIKSNWKDKYTIMLIVALMVIVGFFGFMMSQRGSESSSQVYDSGENEVDPPITESDEDQEDADIDDEDAYGTQYGTDYSTDYIINGSDSRYISKTELYSFSKEQLRLARNEIYARHGYTFEDKSLQNYFSQKSWYIPDYSLNIKTWSDGKFNDYEKKNLDTIVMYEKEKGYR